MLGAYTAMAMAGLLPGDRRTIDALDLNGWNGDLAMGSTEADPYLRARIARHGLLALNNSEAIYFTRQTDDAGEKFREDCTYRLSGGTLPALWWSVTLYDETNFLPRNGDDALSFDASRAVETDGASNWSATVSAARPADGGHWISAKNAGDFDLTLRLYVPDGGVLEAPETMIAAPSVTKLSCAGDAS